MNFLIIWPRKVKKNLGQKLLNWHKSLGQSFSFFFLLDMYFHGLFREIVLFHLISRVFGMNYLKIFVGAANSFYIYICEIEVFLICFQVLQPYVWRCRVICKTVSFSIITSSFTEKTQTITKASVLNVLSCRYTICNMLFCTV